MSNLNRMTRQDPLKEGAFDKKGQMPLQSIETINRRNESWRRRSIDLKTPIGPSTLEPGHFYMSMATTARVQVFLWMTICYRRQEGKIQSLVTIWS